MDVEQVDDDEVAGGVVRLDAVEQVLGADLLQVQHLILGGDEDELLGQPFQIFGPARVHEAQQRPVHLGSSTKKTKEEHSKIERTHSKKKTKIRVDGFVLCWVPDFVEYFEAISFEL